MYMYTKSIYYTISTNDIVPLNQNVGGGGRRGPGVNFINQVLSCLLREQLISSLATKDFWPASLLKKDFWESNDADKNLIDMTSEDAVNLEIPKKVCCLKIARLFWDPPPIPPSPPPAPQSRSGFSTEHLSWVKLTDFWLM